MKDKVVSFRLTEEEYKNLVKLANKEGLEVKDYIKQRIFTSPVVYSLDCDNDEIGNLRLDIRQTIKNTNEILKNKCATRNEVIVIMLVFLAIFISSILILNLKFDWRLKEMGKKWEEKRREEIKIKDITVKKSKKLKPKL